MALLGGFYARLTTTVRCPLPLKRASFIGFGGLGKAGPLLEGQIMLEQTRARQLLFGLFAISLGGCTLGPSELLIVLAIIVLLFGATRLPALGRALGETLKSFRAATTEDTNKPTAVGGSDDRPRIQEGQVEPTDHEKAEHAKHT